MLGILGGGLSGLILSHLIPNSQIIEKSSRPGGLMQSITEDGFTFDLSGGHILFSKKSEIMDFMLSVLGDNVCQRTRNAKISYNGRLIKYPFENGLSDLSKEENFECISDFIKAYMQNHGIRAFDFAEYLRITYGNAISEKYLIPYNEKIWKYPLNKMSADWCEERMPQPTIDSVLKASFGIKSEGYTHQLHFYYPRVGGIEAFIQALSKDKNIKCDQEITHIEKKDNKNMWSVCTDDNLYLFDDIVSTMPLPVLVNCLDDVPLKVKIAAKNLKYNSLITVMIGVNKSISPYSWVYFPGKLELYHRTNLVSNFSNQVAPDGHGALIYEITCHEEDKIYNLPDNEILEMIFGEYLDVVYSKVHRTKYAYVIYDLDYQKNISIIKSFLREREIKTLGRFAEWEYYNMDHCIEKAMIMADKIKYKL